MLLCIIFCFNTVLKVTTPFFTTKSWPLHDRLWFNLKQCRNKRVRIAYGRSLPKKASNFIYKKRKNVGGKNGILQSEEQEKIMVIKNFASEEL